MAQLRITKKVLNLIERCLTDKPTRVHPLALKAWPHLEKDSPEHDYHAKLAGQAAAKLDRMGKARMATDARDGAFGWVRDNRPKRKGRGGARVKKRAQEFLE